MDEYLHYLNTVKSFQHGGNLPFESRRNYNYSSGRYSKDSRNERDRGDKYDSSRRRRPMREYRDLDNPNENIAGRQLISYDDL